MKLDVFDKELRRVRELADELLPIRPCPATLTRWALTGVKAPNGRFVRLPVVKVNGRSYSTPDAFRFFLEATNTDPDPPGPDPETLARTDDDLRAIGLLDDGPTKRSRKNRKPTAAV